MISPIILAMDTDDLDIAKRWISLTNGSVGVYKLGLEFFLKFGPDGIVKIQNETDCEIFLDLKLHDIPNTVGQAVSSVAGLNPKFLTIHASGGSEMVKAAVLAAGKTSITAVTILTSLNNEDLSRIGYREGALTSAVNLAALATSAGATSIVCSPFEVSAIRRRVGSDVVLITPGVRPADSEVGDQKRSTTPAEAIANGADYVVIGRPITSYAKESLGAMTRRASEISSSLL